MDNNSCLQRSAHSFCDRHMILGSMYLPRVVRQLAVQLFYPDQPSTKVLLLRAATTATSIPFLRLQPDNDSLLWQRTITSSYYGFDRRAGQIHRQASRPYRQTDTLALLLTVKSSSCSSQFSVLLMTVAKAMAPAEVMQLLPN